MNGNEYSLYRAIQEIYPGEITDEVLQFLKWLILSRILVHNTTVKGKIRSYKALQSMMTSDKLD